MRVPSGKTDQKIFFVAVDGTDLVTRETGLSAFTVYRSRNGGAATVYTTPTIAELSSSNMPGVYCLTVDEDTTIASTSDSEEYCLHITCSGMAPITRTIELYRRDTTSGNTALVDANGRMDVIKVAGTTQTAGDLAALITAVDDFVDTEVSAIKTQTDKMVFTVANQLDVNVIDWKGAAAPAMTGDAFARLGAPAGVSVSADIAAIKTQTASIETKVDTIDDFVDTEVAAIKAKTDNLPSDPADASDIAGAFTTVNTTLGTIAGYIDTEVAAIFNRIGAPAGASIAADIAAISVGSGGLDAAGVRAAIGLASANLDIQLGAIDDFLDTEVAAIKTKTDGLPSDPADASDIAASFSTVNATLSTIAGYIDTEVAAIKAKTDNLPASPAATSDIPTANANADALLDRANGIETGYTLRQAMRIMSAVLGGKSSGHPGSPVYRNLPDSADRVSATVSSGNRSAVTLNP